MKFVLLKMAECSAKLSIDLPWALSPAEQMCTCEQRWRQRRWRWPPLCWDLLSLHPPPPTFSWSLSVVHYITSPMQAVLEARRPAVWKQLNRNFLSDVIFPYNPFWWCGRNINVPVSHSCKFGLATNNEPVSILYSPRVTNKTNYTWCSR